MTFELQFENILKDFYEYEHFFTQEDFLYFGDTFEDKKTISNRFDKDQRFIKVINENLVDKFFISKKALFELYCRTSLRLAKQKIFRLNQSQLSYLYSSLYRKDKCFNCPLSILVCFGKKYGFIEKIDYDSCNKQYIFPISYILSFTNREKSIDAVNKIIGQISINQTLDNINFRLLCQRFFDKGLTCLTDREKYIIKSREGLLDGQKKTLNKIGNKKEITRERVRQIEKRAWRKLIHHTNYSLFIASLICQIINKKGSFLFSCNSYDSYFVKFIAKCSNVPISYLKHINKIILGQLNNSIYELEGYPVDYIEYQLVLNWLKSMESICLVRQDLQNFSKCIINYSKKALTKEQKVYIAIKKIGKPAHSSRITDMFNSMFPDSLSTEHNVHAVLSRENNGIVWIGIRSTFALKEWGFEHPSLTLFETVKRIVKNKYKETNQPVPFNIIVSEMGKYRRIVNRNSLVIASHCNPALQRIGKNSFIPKDNIEAIQEDDNFEDKLDRVLKEMEG
ncbi:MAG: sigma factor-like helix-turn-helix DNA-binding protein [Candidatus Helarchaeota archaeon]